MGDINALDRLPDADLSLFPKFERSVDILRVRCLDRLGDDFLNKGRDSPYGSESDSLCPAVDLPLEDEILERVDRLSSPQSEALLRLAEATGMVMLIES